jgi:hypothetical protein
MLKGSGFDHPEQQGGGSPFFGLQFGHDLIDGMNVLIFEAATQGVGEKLFRQATIEIQPPFLARIRFKS